MNSSSPFASSFAFFSPNLNHRPPPTILQVNIGQETLGVLLSSEDVLRLAEALEFIHFTDGHCIVHQGNIGEVFYIIYDGTIRVEVDNIEVGKLTVGGYFGERALLRLKLK